MTMLKVQTEKNIYMYLQQEKMTRAAQIIRDNTIIIKPFFKYKKTHSPMFNIKMWGFYCILVQEQFKLTYATQINIMMMFRQNIVPACVFHIQNIFFFSFSAIFDPLEAFEIYLHTVISSEFQVTVKRLSDEGTQCLKQRGNLNSHPPKQKNKTKKKNSCQSSDGKHR